MADQRPVQEVRRRVNGASREILECRSTEEVSCRQVSSGRDSTDSRIWVEAGNNRVAEDQRIRGVEISHGEVNLT